VKWSRKYLPEQPPELKGDARRVTEGLWCAGDEAFAIPIVPFPKGPTEIDDHYTDRGVTSILDLIDAKESVVEIARTKIRPDLREQDVLPNVASRLEGSSDPIHPMDVEWIQQNGRTQIQTVNPSEEYTGRGDIMYLTVSHGWSNMKGACRVDRHFVGAGYYFQIIVVFDQRGEPGAPKPEHDSCAIALELAAWTAENIRVGAKCGG
jgi:hypothetical protein